MSRSGTRFDPRCGKGPRCFAGAGQNSALIFDAGRNTTGNILNAKRGYLAALHPESGRLWVVEHGPQGGDEVNVALAGKNYGWPVIGYGID